MFRGEPRKVKNLGGKHLEDRYPPNAYARQNRTPANTYRQPNNMNPAYMQNSPHSVGAARGANKASASEPQSGVSPYTQDMPNTGAMPYAQNTPNSGMMPYADKQPNTDSGVQSEMTECSYKMGRLPSCAPLSVGYVPFQQPNPPKYSSGDALTRGTLFPGLDLPYLNIVNEDHPYAGTPLGELMALGFVIKELNLYLDTHANDADALAMLQSMNKLMAEGSAQYEKMYGPIMISNIVSGDEFTWLNNPWPWDYNERPVAK